jgi:hypothetical protein
LGPSLLYFLDIHMASSIIIIIIIIISSSSSSSSSIICIFYNNINLGRALVRWLVAGFPPQQQSFDPKPGRVGFVMNKVAMGRVFS